ncbi:MAG: DUF1722 domain-containing protein [Anaeromyxobacter sp.]|nr:DUF1722 domain-containing protein [Anaeromyxobacter sp.]
MATPTTKPRLGISACLLGRGVRYDGGHKQNDFCTDVLGPFVEWVALCPEVEVGMSIPRPSIRLTGQAAAPRLVAERTGEDWTERMAAYAEAKVAQLAALDLSGYVTKKDSPSCGLARVRVYGPRSGQPVRDGTGAFVRVLQARLPLLPVEEEGRLNDPLLRESFIERIFGYARWKALVEGGLTRGGLVAFHTAHKLALLAHHPDGYRKLGSLVARAKGRPIGQVADEYGALFMASLGKPATRGRHLNVLQHMAGYFKELPKEERRELEGVVADFGRGHVPLVVPLTLFRSQVRRHAVTWLAGQTYLDPDPKELMLRNHA